MATTANQEVRLEALIDRLLDVNKGAVERIAGLLEQVESSITEPASADGTKRYVADLAREIITKAAGSVSQISTVMEPHQARIIERFCPPPA